MSAPILALRGIYKAFPGVQALAGVSLDLMPGEVHALVGENGAGKSTLIKIAAGVYTPDAGEIRVNGHPVQLQGPRHATALGIVVVHQEPYLFPTLSVLENLFMGFQLRRGPLGWLDWSAMARQAEEVLRKLGITLPLDIPAGELSAAQQQLLQIARALLQDAKVLIMDEPTSSLYQKEVEILFDIVHRLQAHGVCILYITPRLEEVFALAHRVTVLRDGRLVGTYPVKDVTPAALIAHMVGREVSQLFPHTPHPPGRPLLRVHNLGRTGLFAGISFEVRAGEIVGVYGLVGSGRSEMAQSFIIQLADERPSHIITPAIHKRREDISLLFQRHLGMPPTTDIEAMTQAARQRLREIFLSARMGISGVNFGIAESGTIVLVTNEGNGRMVTTLPSIHVALMGIERVVPTWEDAEILLRVLARSATGQALTAYTSFLTGPRRPDEPDGPEELHVVLVDNGRSRWLGTPLEEALYCIRCGACLNVCPVYRAIGGHAYGSVYPGPIGSIVTPMLFGTNRAELAYASTLCGACQDICPVHIAIPDLLLRWRRMSSPELLPAWERWALCLYGFVASNPRLWRLLGSWLQKLLRRMGSQGWLRSGPGPLRAWTATRDFPVPGGPSFREWWAARREER